MLPDGRPHRLLNTTHHVVFKPLRGIACKKRKFMLFDAIDQGLARFLVETVMLNTPHEFQGRLWLAFERGHGQGT